MRVKFFGVFDLNVLPIKEVPIRKRLLGWKNIIADLDQAFEKI